MAQSLLRRVSIVSNSSYEWPDEYEFFCGLKNGNRQKIDQVWQRLDPQVTKFIKKMLRWRGISAAASDDVNHDAWVGLLEHMAGSDAEWKGPGTIYRLALRFASRSDSAKRSKPPTRNKKASSAAQGSHFSRPDIERSKRALNVERS